MAATDLDLDVLIAGAGPTGLMLANEMARRSSTSAIRYQVVDAAPGPSTHTKAMAVQVRTLEVYDDLGLVDKGAMTPARSLSRALSLFFPPNPLSRARRNAND